MPTLARPDVDVLDGLTTAIIVDQQRMGTDPRSTVDTATDANAMLRILFSRLGRPRIGSAQAFSFNVVSISGAGAVTRRGGRPDGQGAAQLLHHRRHVPALRGPRLGQRLRPGRAVRRGEVAQRGRAHHPRLQHGRLRRRTAQRRADGAPCRRSRHCWRTCGAPWTRSSRSGWATCRTGRHLDDRAALKPDVRKPSGALEVRGASAHNLRGVDVDIPLGVLVVVTGVAGSGKSSLVREACGAKGRISHGSVSGRDGMVATDRSPIRGSRRSNPATYTGRLDPIRKAFAKANEVKPALFSANSEAPARPATAPG